MALTLREFCPVDKTIDTVQRPENKLGSHNQRTSADSKNNTADIKDQPVNPLLSESEHHKNLCDVGRYGCDGVNKRIRVEHSEHRHIFEEEVICYHTANKYARRYNISYNPELSGVNLQRFCFVVLSVSLCLSVHPIEHGEEVHTVFDCLSMQVVWYGETEDIGKQLDEAKQVEGYFSLAA